MKKLIIVLMLTGCSSVYKTQVNNESASIQGDLRDWSSMTDDQKHHRYWQVGRAVADYDKHENGTETPLIYQNDPWAPVISGSAH